MSEECQSLLIVVSVLYFVCTIKTNFNSSTSFYMMSVKLAVVLLLLCFVSVRTIPMTIYTNAWFEPSNVANTMTNLISTATMEQCACQCSNNSLCVTGTYFGINQTCVLFSAHLWQGQIRIIINIYATVFTFINRTTELGKRFAKYKMKNKKLFRCNQSAFDHGMAI